jgi:amino acid adenylation domain-containing protein
LSFPQQRLWFLDQLDPGNSAYYVGNAILMTGYLRIPLFRQALNLMVVRHEALRTTFPVVDGTPIQQILPVAPAPFVVTDLRPYALSFDADVVRQMIRDEVEQPFDLVAAAPWRGRLLCLEDELQILVLTMHHIISDGWSWGVFLSELVDTYNQLVTDVPPTLPPLPIQYADVALWQRELAQQPVMQQHTDYWAKQLRDLPPPLALPADHPRSAAQRPTKAWLTRPFPPEIHQALEAQSRRMGVTPYMIMLAALKVLLYRYTGQHDLVVASLIANRTRPEFEAQIGIFINMLMLRTNLSGTPTAQAVIERVQQVSRAAYEHQDMPMEFLLEILQLEHTLDRSPLSNVLFVFQNAPEKPINMIDIQLDVLSAPKWTTEFDLTLELTVGGTTLALEYNAQIFEQTTVERLYGHYLTLLSAMIAQPDQSIDALPLLTATEAAHFQEWNRTNAELPADRYWLESFEAQVARTPAAIAASCGAENLSYAELDRRANSLAQRLVAAGVGPEMIVAVLAERSLAFLTTIIAIFKAGGVYLPLDPFHPPQRLRQVLEQSAAALVLVAEPLATVIHEVVESLPSEQQPRIQLIDQQIEAAPEAPRPPCDRHSLAYVIYTSGSTGIPKGAMVEHGGMINHLSAKNRDLSITAEDRVAQNGPQTFDISVWQFLSALIVGGSVKILPDAIAHDPRRLLEAVEAQAITILQVVPSMLRAMLGEIAQMGDSRPALPALRWIVPTGEALPTSLTQKWLSFYPAIPVLNTYGATECSDDQCHLLIDHADQLNLETAIVSIGTPIINIRTYVLDPRGYRVPIGVTGELYIGGIGVGRGYLRNPGRTAEAFVPDPFAEQPGRRLYKTGDLARFRPDGSLEFLGRVDHQVKIRGFRIELGEIEHVLAQHPSVRAAVVTAHMSQPGQARLVAYILPHGSAPGVEEVQTFVSAHLPGYMTPDVIMFLDAFPLTPNGKLDRARLPQPDLSLRATTPLVAPRTPSEQRMAEVWSEVLGVAQIGVYDNFFALGGHSLLAARLTWKVREVFAVDLPLRSLFLTPTVAGLVETIGEHVPAQPELPAVQLDPARRFEPFPLTDLQQAYWVGETGLFDLGNVSGHIFQELECVGLDLARVETALQQVIARHDMLRAIVLPDGQQQVLPSVPAYRIPVSDLREQSQAEIERQLGAVRAAMSQHGPSTDQWPLFEIRAALLPEGRIRLQLNICLLICDGWSLAIVLSDLLKLYPAPAAPLPPLTLTFRDYLRAVQQLQQGPAFEQAQAYWLHRAPTMPAAPQLPLAQHPATLRDTAFVRRRNQLPAALWQQLQAQGNHHGLTMNAILCAVYTEVLATWSAQPHFTLNIMLSERQPLHPEVEQIVGNLSTTLLLEVRHNPRESFLERARRLQSQLWSDLDHAAMNGVAVNREIARAQGWGAQTATPVVFASMLNVPVSQRDRLPSDLEVIEIASGVQTPQVWLDHQIFEEAGELVYSWDAVEALFPAGLIEAMFAAYSGLLHTLAADPAAWEHDQRLLVPTQQLAQFAAVNATEGPAPALLLHELAEIQARQRPEQICVVAGDRRLSYAEVVEQSRALGSHLRQLGAQPNQLIAVVMEKGWEQVVAVLSILYAGAAYVPIDPGLPTARLHYLFANTEAVIALTQSWLDRRLDWPANVQRIALDTMTLPEAPQQMPEPVQQPTDLAYVIYTSGSTGQPKGVMIDHRGALNTILGLNEDLGIGANDRVLALSSLSFDLSVYDIFGMLAAGGTIVMPPAASLRDPSAWIELVREHRVTLWNSVPALMELLIGTLEAQPDRLSLRQIWLSGDWIPVTLPDRIRAQLPQARVISMGGATEASIWSIIYPIEQVDPAWQSIPYGTPLRNQCWYVLNTALQPQPIWVPGSLYIGGIGLALGYWRDPERTAASFISHPQTGERLYRTGDLGRYLPDGTIEFLGRDDFQVKIQGYRIELGEIEAVLSRHPAVQSVAVIARDDRPGEKYLAAYTVLHDQYDATPQELRQFVHEHLPAYMVPASIIVLPALPLSANGKVDRGALPSSWAATDSAVVERISPQDELEQRLVEIWTETLDLPAIQLDSNFFDLGGTSISAIRLINRVQQIFGHQLELATLFTEGTIIEQARLLRQKINGSAQGTKIP